MKNNEMAQAMLERAEVVLHEARYLFQKGHWNLVIRRCQESVELALKAALLWAGVEVPRVHDVGPLLKREAQRFPLPFRDRIFELASISRALRAERELSFYGDEATGIPAEELYTRNDAQLKLTETVLAICKMLFDGEEAHP